MLTSFPLWSTKIAATLRLGQVAREAINGSIAM
jgi:hypothetical protein